MKVKRPRLSGLVSQSVSSSARCSQTWSCIGTGLSTHIGHGSHQRSDNSAHILALWVIERHHGTCLRNDDRTRRKKDILYKNLLLVEGMLALDDGKNTAVYVARFRRDGHLLPSSYSFSANMSRRGRSATICLAGKKQFECRSVRRTSSVPTVNNTHTHKRRQHDYQTAPHLRCTHRIA